MSENSGLQVSSQAAFRAAAALFIGQSDSRHVPRVEIQIAKSYNRWMGMLDFIVVFGLVSVLYLYLRQSSEP